MVADSTRMLCYTLIPEPPRADEQRRFACEMPSPNETVS